MANQTYSKNLEVFSKVITTLATDAASKVDGVSLATVKRSKEAVAVSFLPNEKVSVDISIIISSSCIVPETVANLQKTVKSQIEGTTKFKVHAVDVKVQGVKIES